MGFVFGDAGEGVDVQLFAAGRWVHAGRAQCFLRGGGAACPARQGGAQRLAALGEGGVDHREHLFTGGGQIGRAHV